jgi:hypothetical protein
VLVSLAWICTYFITSLQKSWRPVILPTVHGLLHLAITGKLYTWPSQVSSIPGHHRLGLHLAITGQLYTWPSEIRSPTGHHRSTLHLAIRGQLYNWPSQVSSTPGHHKLGLHLAITGQLYTWPSQASSTPGHHRSALNLAITGQLYNWLLQVKLNCVPHSPHMATYYKSFFMCTWRPQRFLIFSRQGSASCLANKSLLYTWFHCVYYLVSHVRLMPGQYKWNVYLAIIGQLFIWPSFAQFMHEGSLEDTSISSHFKYHVFTWPSQYSL